MDKKEAWKKFGQLSKEQREFIKAFFKDKLISEGVNKPGSILIINAILDHYINNGDWEFKI